MKEGFHTIIASPSEYEQLVVEIYFNDQFVGLISRELGPDKLEFELWNGPNDPPTRMDLTGFEDAVSFAKRRLLGLAP